MGKLIKIGIHSVPRSGSTWLGEIFDSNENVAYRFQPLFSYRHKSFLNENSDFKKINDFFDSIYSTNDEFVLQATNYRKKLKPNFIKSENITHIIYKEVRYHNILSNLLAQSTDVKIIGLIRNPFAVINSWLKAPKEFREDLGWEIAEEWRDAPSKNMNKAEEYNGYNKWKEACFMFLELIKKYPAQVYLVDYGDLVKDTKTEVKKVFDFCELNFSSQTEHFIHESTTSQSNDAYAVFKEKKDDLGWKGKLPTIIEKEIKEDKDFIKLNEIFKWI